MSDTTQAQADLPDDQVTVSDPLDAENSTNGGMSDLAKFEEEMAIMDMTPAPQEQGETPENGEEGESTEGQPSEENEQESPEEESDEPEESEDEPAANTSNRFRIRAKDDVEAEALALRKRHPDWSLEKCIASAKDILGVKPESGEQHQDSPQQADTGESIEAQLKELRQKHKEATTALEFESAADIFEQIEALRDKQVVVRISEMQEKSRAEQRQAEEYDRKWDESERQAVTFYPAAKDPNSALSKKIAELDQRMKDLGDDLFFDPEKPFILAKEAARILKVPMADPKAAKAAKSVSSPKSPIEPASGNARTTPVSPTKRLNEELDALDSLDAFEAHVGAMSFG